jgi:hypothetical protein
LLRVVRVVGERDEDGGEGRGGILFELRWKATAWEKEVGKKGSGKYVI